MLKHTSIETFVLKETPTKKITLTAYISGLPRELIPNRRKLGVLICPGGGYRYTSEKEAEPIALAFLSKGINAFVLDYSVCGGETENESYPRFPAQLIEAATAMNFIKTNAEKFDVEPDCVFVNGYSAGGHLAASLGTLYNSSYVKEALGIMGDELRPAGMILAYPVITSGEYAHRDSFNALLGKNASDAELLDKVSIEKLVKEDTVPAFIWHTRTDELVPVNNSILLANALAQKGVKFELHIYPKGFHGLALATDVTNFSSPTVATWFDDCVRWLKDTAPEKNK